MTLICGITLINISIKQTHISIRYINPISQVAMPKHTKKDADIWALDISYHKEEDVKFIVPTQDRDIHCIFDSLKSQRIGHCLFIPAAKLHQRPLPPSLQHVCLVSRLLFCFPLELRGINGIPVTSVQSFPGMVDQYGFSMWYKRYTSNLSTKFSQYGIPVWLQYTSTLHCFHKQQQIVLEA